MIDASLTLTILAFCFEKPLQARLDMTAAGALFALATVGTAIPFLTYFILVQRAGAFFASLFGYLVPLFGILFSSALLREPVTPVMGLGMALIFIGVSLIRKRTA
jgi:drug/metabolite transporter (DMT)-like permease